MNIGLNLIAVKTLIRKEVFRVLRIWVQTIVPPAITMTLPSAISQRRAWVVGRSPPIPPALNVVTRAEERWVAPRRNAG